MNKNSEKLDDQIDRFLQAEEDGLKPRFSNANLAREIFSENHSDKGRNLLILFSLVGLAACLVFAFLSHFTTPSDSSDSLTQRSQVQSVEPLHGLERHFYETQTLIYGLL